MSYRRLGLSLSVATAMVAALAAPASADAIPMIDDSDLSASTTTVGGVGGAPSLDTTDTVAHWFGQTANPHDGLTYGYNMVGADPNSCSGSACDVTVQADLVPLIVNVGGMTFSGNDVMAATLDSPVFATNDYGSTPKATWGLPFIPRGPGGELSAGDAGIQLQLEDATMRAQFNQTGTSSYHLRLDPQVQPAETIDVPSNHGHLAQSARGVVFAIVDVHWWATRIQNLQVKADPTHLPIYTTDKVLLNDGTRCCVVGFHGAGTVPGHTNGSGHGNGKQPVQTFAWATYLTPGIYARNNGSAVWAVQDIQPLSHEISEWADDPFDNNWVEPWVTPTAPQNGCTGVMETGDPVVGIGFAMGGNSYFQGANPNGTHSADGYYHPEDEVLLPWFMRTANPSSEPVQGGGTSGRYTLMGNLNRFAGFGTVATGC